MTRRPLGGLWGGLARSFWTWWSPAFQSLPCIRGRCCGAEGPRPTLCSDRPLSVTLRRHSHVEQAQSQWGGPSPSEPSLSHDHRKQVSGRCLPTRPAPPPQASVLFLYFLRPGEASFWLGWPAAAPSLRDNPGRPRQTRGRGAQAVLGPLPEQQGVCQRQGPKAPMRAMGTAVALDELSSSAAWQR